MKLKAKLLSTIAAACMVICLLAVGVWAVSAGTINITGSVSFNTDNVYVSILGQVEGTATAVDDYSATWNVETEEADLEDQDWDLSGMVFARDGDKLSEITITITVTNLAERQATVTFEDVSEALAEDAGITIEMSEKVVVLEPTGAADGKDSAEFTITITPVDDDANKTVKGDDFAATLTIENGATTADPDAGV